MRRVHGIALAVVVLSTAVLAGCGSDDVTAAQVTPTPTVTQSTSSTPAASPGSATSSDDLLESVAKAATKAGTVKATISTNAGSADVVGAGAFEFGTKPAASYTVSVRTDGSEQKYQMVLVDGAVYLNLTGLGTAGAKVGKPWVKIPSGGTDQLSTTFTTLAASLTQAGDVAASLRLLDAGATITEQGQERVDGVNATKYLITTDVAQAIDASSGTTKKRLEALKAEGVSTVTSTLWVDANDLPVRYEQSTTSQGVTVTTTVRYSAWGKPVAITAPPADQVGSIADLLAG